MAHATGPVRPRRAQAHADGFCITHSELGRTVRELGRTVRESDRARTST